MAGDYGAGRLNFAALACTRIELTAARAGPVRDGATELLPPAYSRAKGSFLMTSTDAHPSLVETLRPKLTPCRIREFRPEDLEACAEIHRSNEPDLLNPDALPAFVEFLAHGTSYILVVELDSKVVACAALELLGEVAAARLLHAMVHRDFQRRGIGTTLLAARLSLLEPEGDEAVRVVLRTAPAPAAFYGAFGFALHTLEKESGTAILHLAVAARDIEAIRSELAGHGVEIELNEVESFDALEAAGDE